MPDVADLETGFRPARGGSRAAPSAGTARAPPIHTRFPVPAACDRRQHRLPSSWVSLPACVSPRLAGDSRAQVPPRRRNTGIFCRCGERGVVSLSEPCPSRTSARYRAGRAFPCRSGRLALSTASRIRLPPPSLPSQLPRKHTGSHSRFARARAAKTFSLRLRLREKLKPCGFRFHPLRVLRSHAARMPRGAGKGRLDRTGGWK